MIAGYFFGALTSSGIKESKSDGEVEDLPVYILMVGISSTIVISSIFALFFLLWDTISSRGKYIIQPYGFATGLWPPDKQCGLLFGRHNTREQFRYVYYPLIPLQYPLINSEPAPTGRTTFSYDAFEEEWGYYVSSRC